MGRERRLQVPDGIFHVTTRGNRGQPIVTDVKDVRTFLGLLAEVAGRHRWRSHSYCVMTNHYHLVVLTPGETLSVGFHQLNSAYAHYFNARHGVTGHLFERRFASKHVTGTAQLLSTYRYVERNPVRAGLCAHPAEWTWSSFRAIVGRSPRPNHLDADEVLALFAVDRERATQLFREFVCRGE